MRVILLAAVLAMTASDALAGEHSVRGYVKRDGTYVAPHMQTNPNGTRADNWSTEGNVNPYTGQEGTKPLYPSAPRYYAPAAPAPAYVAPSYTIICHAGSRAVQQPNGATACVNY